MFLSLAVGLLDLADDLAGFAQALHHLQAFLASSDSVVTLLEKVVKFLGSVHLFEQFSLHFVFGKSSKSSGARTRRWYEEDILH